jgi:hypothetical protein
MGTADAVLPWALKILMIALVTVAVFIYRKPFSHLFSAVGYGTLGSTERAEYSLREASHTFRRSTLDAATAAVPGMASYRAARWARRNPGQAAAVAVGASAGVAAGASAGVAAGTAAGRGAAAEAAGSAADPAAAGTGDAYASRLRPDAPPPADQERDRGGRRQRPGGPPARPAAAARRERGRRAERIRRIRIRAGHGLVPRCRALGGHRAGGHGAAAAGGIGSAGPLVGPPVGPRARPLAGRAPAGQEPEPGQRSRAAGQPSRPPPVQLRLTPIELRRIQLRRVQRGRVQRGRCDRQRAGLAGQRMAQRGPPPAVQRPGPAEPGAQAAR